MRTVSVMTCVFALPSAMSTITAISPAISKRSVAASAQQACAASSSSFIAFWMAASFSSSLGVRASADDATGLGLGRGTGLGETGAGATTRREREQREARHTHQATFGRRYDSTQSTISFVLAPGVKIFAADLLELGQVVLRHDAAAKHDHVAGAARLERVDHGRKQRHVRARHDRQPDGVDRFLDGGGRDHLRRLMQTRVDHFVAGVGERAGNDLRATIVTVETGLGDQDTQFAITHD